MADLTKEAIDRINTLRDLLKSKQEERARKRREIDALTAQTDALYDEAGEIENEISRLVRS